MPTPSPQDQRLKKTYTSLTIYSQTDTKVVAPADDYYKLLAMTQNSVNAAFTIYRGKDGILKFLKVQIQEEADALEAEAVILMRVNDALGASVNFPKYQGLLLVPVVVKTEGNKPRIYVDFERYAPIETAPILPFMVNNNRKPNKTQKAVGFYKGMVLNAINRPISLGDLLDLMSLVLSHTDIYDCKWINLTGNKCGNGSTHDNVLVSIQNVMQQFDILLTSLMQLSFETNFIHSDMHLGNIVYDTKHNNFVCIDYGRSYISFDNIQNAVAQVSKVLPKNFQSAKQFYLVYSNYFRVIPKTECPVMMDIMGLCWNVYTDLYKRYLINTKERHPEFGHTQWIKSNLDSIKGYFKMDIYGGKTFIRIRFFNSYNAIIDYYCGLIKQNLGSKAHIMNTIKIGIAWLCLYILCIVGSPTPVKINVKVENTGCLFGKNYIYLPADELYRYKILMTNNVFHPETYSHMAVEFADFSKEFVEKLKGFVEKMKGSKVGGYTQGKPKSSRKTKSNKLTKMSNPSKNGKRGGNAEFTQQADVELAQHIDEVFNKVLNPEIDDEEATINGYEWIMKPESQQVSNPTIAFLDDIAKNLGDNKLAFEDDRGDLESAVTFSEWMLEKTVQQSSSPLGNSKDLLNTQARLYSSTTPAISVGGVATIPKKTTEKVTILGRKRTVYTSKGKKWVMYKGQFVPLSVLKKQQQ
jgi:hypothetical protein